MEGYLLWKFLNFFGLHCVFLLLCVVLGSGQDEEGSESNSEIGTDENDSSEDELTKSGRETKKLLSKTLGTDGSSDEDEDEEDYDQLAKKIGTVCTVVVNIKL